MENKMEERFDKKFPVNEDLSIAGQSTAIKLFIQSEIDLAVAEREKEMVKKIRNTFKCEVIDGIKTGMAYMGEDNIVSLITNKSDINK